MKTMTIHQSSVVRSVSLTSACNNWDFDNRFAFIFSSQHVSTTGALFTWWFILEWQTINTQKTIYPRPMHQSFASKVNHGRRWRVCKEKLDWLKIYIAGVFWLGTDCTVSCDGVKLEIGLCCISVHPRKGWGTCNHITFSSQPKTNFFFLCDCNNFSISSEQKILRETLPKTQEPKALTHSTPFVQNRSFDKFWSFGQTSTCVFGKGQDIHRATLTNPRNNFNKFM